MNLLLELEVFPSFFSMLASSIAHEYLPPSFSRCLRVLFSIDYRRPEVQNSMVTLLAILLVIESFCIVTRFHVFLSRAANYLQELHYELERVHAYQYFPLERPSGLPKCWRLIVVGVPQRITYNP